MNVIFWQRCCRVVTKNPRFTITATERFTNIQSCTSVRGYFDGANHRRNLASNLSQNSISSQLKKISFRRYLQTSQLRFADNEIEIGEQHCVSLEDLERKLENDNVLLVDVRRQDEVDSGRIPGKRFLHIPLDQVAEAFQMTNSDFKARYGADKPPTDENDIVFYCRSGRRSGLALGIVQPLGYSKSKHFAGGWLEWSAK